MSILSQLTGIHISPKGAKLTAPDPIGAGKAALSDPWVQGGAGILTGGMAIPALMGAAGGLANGKGVTGAVTGALSGGLAGKTGNTVDSFLSSLLSKGSSTPGAPGGTNWMDIAKGIFSGGGADGQGSLGTIGDLAGKLGGGASAGSGLGSTSLLDDLLMGGTIASGVADKQRAQGFQDKAASYATGDYDKNAPLRDQARTLVQDRSTPDLSSIFANSENPYDRARRGAPQLGTRVPVASTY